MKIVDKILTALGYIIMIVPYCVLGWYVVKGTESVFSVKEKGFIFMLIAEFLLAAVFWFLHIIIHEGGHLIGGLMSGWKFLSFRIGKLTLVNQNGKLNRKKTMVMGTGGQCLMIPPECDYEKCPFFLYLFGGGFTNLLTGGIAIAVGIFTGGIAQIILNIFAIIGIGVGLSNLFPAKMAGMMNDGYQIFVEFPRNSNARKYTCCLMMVNAIFTEQDSTKALPEDVKSMILDLDGSDLSSMAVVNLLFFKNTMLYEKCRYKEAQGIFQKIIDDANVLQVFKNEAKCERLYYEIMGACNEKKVEELYDKKLREYIEATALYPSRKRLMYAYYLVCKKDEEKADKEYQALLKAVKSHPSKVESAVELKEAERIRAHYECKYWNNKEPECRG